MPISVTGNRLRRDAGVSLVEVLTALMVVGLLAGAVVLLAPGPDHKARVEAERVAARILAASDESVLSNRSMALVVTPEGYGFERLEPEGWRPAAGSAVLSFRAWPDDFDVRIEERDGDAADTRVIRFDPLGGATPAKLLLSAAGARWSVAVDGQGRTYVSRAE